MAGLTTESKSNIAFKKLVGKAHTGNAIPFYSESISSQVWIDTTEIVGSSIASDPQTAVNNGQVEFIEADLVEIPAANGFAYDIVFPAGYSGNYGSGAAGQVVRDFTQIVDQKLNLGDGPAVSGHTGGYVYDLRDNGTSVPVGATENWQVDPVAGIVVSETELNLGTTGTIRLYVYTGQTLEQRLAGIAGGGSFGGTTDDVVEGSTNLYFTDGRAISAVENTAALNLSGDLDVDGDTFLDNVTIDGSVTINGTLSTDELVEGSTNLFFTEERVDDRVADLLVGGVGITLTYDDTAGTVTIDSQSIISSTDDVAEGSANLYFTEERAQDAVFSNVIGGNNTDVSYDDTAGTLTIDVDTATLEGNFLRNDGDTATGDYDFNTGLFVLNQSANDITSDGDFTTTGTVTCNELIETSRRSVKTDVRSLGSQLDMVSQLEPVTYRWKTTGQKTMGLIAEEVEKIYPDLVARDRNGDISGINYTKITSVLIQSVKELKAELADVREQLAQA